jgi:ribosomal protein L32
MAVPKKKKSLSFTRIHRYFYFTLIKKKRLNYISRDFNTYNKSIINKLNEKKYLYTFIYKI